MGLLDKVKMAAKNADSKAGEMLDENKLKADIAKEKTTINNAYTEIGKIYYEKGIDAKKELKELCDKIKKAQANIKKYEKEIKDVKAAAKEERERNRAVAQESDFSK